VACLNNFMELPLTEFCCKEFCIKYDVMFCVSDIQQYKSVAKLCIGLLSCMNKYPGLEDRLL
jgi:hypothetical protein